MPGPASMGDRPSVRLIVGLGNPGKRYERTRHNIGFRCVEALARRWGFQFRRERCRAEVAEGEVFGHRVTLGKPLTYMNLSGEAVRCLIRLANLEPSALLVIADDLDLPFGRLRLREKGSSGGQRGIQSIIDQLGTDHFLRLRVGIGRPPAGVDPVDYVLSTFTADEEAVLDGIIDRVVAGIEILLTRGLGPAMNFLNAPIASIPPAPIQ